MLQSLADVLERRLAGYVEKSRYRAVRIDIRSFAGERDFAAVHRFPDLLAQRRPTAAGLGINLRLGKAVAGAVDERAADFPWTKLAELKLGAVDEDVGGVLPRQISRECACHPLIELDLKRCATLDPFVVHKARVDGELFRQHGFDALPQRRVRRSRGIRIG